MEWQTLFAPLSMSVYLNDEEQKEFEVAMQAAPENAV